jgi:hypothetical protein
MEHIFQLARVHAGVLLWARHTLLHWLLVGTRVEYVWMLPLRPQPVNQASFLLLDKAFTHVLVRKISGATGLLTDEQRSWVMRDVLEL